MEWEEILSPEFIATIIFNIASIAAAMAGGIKIFMSKWKEEKEKDRQEKDGVLVGLDLQAQTDMRINQKLEEVKDLLNADRVQVYDFHNGVHYSSGRSAVKITCTYESCRAGVNHCQNNLIALPISCLPNFVNKLIADGEFICHDLEEMKEKYPATYSFKKNMDIKAFHDIVFRNEKGDIIGFIAVQFTENQYYMDEAILHRLVGFVEAELTYLLSVTRNSK